MSHNKRKQIVPDPDRWGLAGATLTGTVVMAVNFWRDLDGFEIAWRVGLAFTLTYAVVFLFVRLLRRTLMTEALRRQQEREQQQDKAAGAGGDTAESR